MREAEALHSAAPSGHEVHSAVSLPVLLTRSSTASGVTFPRTVTLFSGKSTSKLSTPVRSDNGGMSRPLTVFACTRAERASRRPRDREALENGS